MSHINVSMSIESGLKYGDAHIQVTLNATFEDMVDPMVVHIAKTQEWGVQVIKEGSVIVDAEMMPSKYDATKALDVIDSFADEEFYDGARNAIVEVADDLPLLCAGQIAVDDVEEDLREMGLEDPKVTFSMDS